MKRFEIGTTYRTYGRYDFTRDFTVIKRTACFIVVRDPRGKEIRTKILKHIMNEETASIDGMTISAGGDTVA